MAVTDKAGEKAKGGLWWVLVIAVVIAIVAGTATATDFLSNVIGGVGVFFRGIWEGGSATVTYWKSNFTWS